MVNKRGTNHRKLYPINFMAEKNSPGARKLGYQTHFQNHRVNLVEINDLKFAWNNPTAGLGNWSKDPYFGVARVPAPH